MKIVYDGAIFSMQRVGGISRYFHAILNNLPTDVDAQLIAMDNCDLSWLTDESRIEVIRVRSGSLPKMLTSVQRWLGRRTLEGIEARIDAQIAHWTYYVGLHRRRVKRRQNRLQVVTVYDFIHEIFPETDRSGKETRWKREALLEADLIICISETTLRDLQHWYPEVAKRAIAIPLGNPLEGVTKSELPASLKSKPFVLFVGGRRGYKNFGTVASAWKTVSRKYPELQLAIVGHPMDGSEISQWGLTDVKSNLHLLGHVGDHVLAGLYSAATAFVFSSRYEGFGLPAVEAMSCGCLLLASTGGSLPEVVGNGGLLFEPDDVEHLTKLITDAVENAAYLSEVRKTGAERSKLYSWKRTADQTFAAYRNALESRNI